jgi:hypothetical protein
VKALVSIATVFVLLSDGILRLRFKQLSYLYVKVRALDSILYVRKIFAFLNSEADATVSVSVSVALRKQHE